MVCLPRLFSTNIDPLAVDDVNLLVLMDEKNELVSPKMSVRNKNCKCVYLWRNQEKNHKIA